MQAQYSGPEHRQVGAGGVDGLAQIQDIIASDPRATIHDGGLLPDRTGLSTKDSLRSRPPPCLVTHLAKTL